MQTSEKGVCIAASGAVRTMQQETSEPYPISVPVLRKQERGLRGAVKYVRGAFDRFSLSSLQ